MTGKTLINKIVAFAVVATALAALASVISGCESFSQARFAVDVLQGDASLGVSYGDGKAVVEAGQGADKIRFSGRRQ